MPSLDRRQIGRGLMFLVLFLNLGLFLWIQLDRAAIGELEQRLVLLQTSSIDPGSPRSPVVLRRELDETQERAGEASAVFPARVDAKALQDHILTVAQRASVQLVSLSLVPTRSRALATVNYPVVTITTTARGDLPTLLNFLGQVERGIYRTTVLENFKVMEEKEDWSIQFDLVVFGRPL